MLTPLFILLIATLSGTFITTFAQETDPPYANKRQYHYDIISEVEVYKYADTTRVPRVSVYLGKLVQHHGETKAKVLGICEVEVSVLTEKEPKPCATDKEWTLRTPLVSEVTSMNLLIEVTSPTGGLMRLWLRKDEFKGPGSKSGAKSPVDLFYWNAPYPVICEADLYS